MWEPKISDVIRELEYIKSRQGDILVVGYNNETDESYRDVSPEYNDDGGVPLALLIVTDEDD